MDATDITAYLESHRSGVLCVGASDGGQGLPVTFSYDDENRHVYLRYAHEPDSRRELSIGTGDQVSLVSYDDGDGLESVVAEGRLELLSEPTIDGPVLQSIDDLGVPVADVLEAGADAKYLLARIDVTNVSGRRSERVPS